MAHIRQILANLSISVSEFKKNPKTVIKAVKSEPIAVIINDKPAFYCVPADILESLYSKFYEMNEIQNIQEFNNDSDDPVCASDDDSFGVRDIFQTIEDEQSAKLDSSDDLVDPIKNSVADPLDEEVANKLNCSIDKHLLDSSNKVVSLNNSGSMDLSFDDLEDSSNINSFEDFNGIDPICSNGFDDSLLCNFDNEDKLNVDNDVNYVSSLSDLDNLPSPVIQSSDERHSEATLAHAEKVVMQEQEKTLESKLKEQASTKKPEDKPDSAKKSAESSSKNNSKPDSKSPNSAKEPSAAPNDMAKQNAQEKASPKSAIASINKKELSITQGSDHKLTSSKSPIASISQASSTTSSGSSTGICEDLGEVNSSNKQNMRSLVSGPHSFSLEHVAKTYSPYKQKKLLEKRQQELKKEQKAEQKAKQKELKKLEKAAKYLKLDANSAQEADKKSAKDSSKTTKKSKKSKFVKVSKDDLKNV